MNEAAAPPGAASEVVPRRTSSSCQAGPTTYRRRTAHDLSEGLHRSTPSSTGRRQPQSVFPRDRGAGAGVLEGRQHLPGQRRAARPGPERRQRVRLLRRTAVRQRAAALRPPADRLRQGPDPALPDHARAPGGAPVRLGHPRPARGAGGDAPARAEDHRGDPRPGHREVQRRLPGLGDAVHLRVARLRHPAGPLGRLRPRLPDPESRLHGVGDVGLQAALRQGAGLRGLPGAAVLLERRDPAVHPRAADGRRRLPEPPGPVGHRRTAAGDWRAGAGVDDHAVDPALQPRDHGRRGHRLRRGRGRRAGRRGAHRALRHRRSPAGVVRPRARPSRWTERAADRGAADRRRAGRAHLHPAVLLLPRPRERVPRGDRRVRDHHRRHRPGAHGRRLR